MARIAWNAGNEEVKDGYTLLPDGEYQLKIVKAELGESKAKIPQVVVDFMVTNSLQYDGEPVKFHRVTLIPNDQKGSWIAKSFLRAIGEPYMGDNVEVDTDRWLGKIITADVYSEEYESKRYNRVKNFRASDFIEPPKPPDDEDIPF